MLTDKTNRILYWAATVLFCLQIGFTAYAQLTLPQAAQEFAHIGMPASWFRIELSCAKFAGVVALLIPAVPPRLKEWAYAGFAITLISAIVGHLATGEGFNTWGWAAGTLVLWALSYVFWRRVGSGASASGPGMARPQN